MVVLGVSDAGADAVPAGGVELLAGPISDCFRINPAPGAALTRGRATTLHGSILRAPRSAICLTVDPGLMQMRRAVHGQSTTIPPQLLHSPTGVRADLPGERRAVRRVRPCCAIRCGSLSNRLGCSGRARYGRKEGIDIGDREESNRQRCARAGTCPPHRPIVPALSFT